MATIALRRPALNQKKLGIFVLDHIIEMCLLILILVLTFGSHGFLTWANWMNIFRSNSLKGVISLGMTLTLIAGQVDLSIGSTVGLSGVIVAIICREMVARGADVNVACLIGIVVCFAMAIGVGWMHGFFQHKVGMPAFIITLASKFALYGAAGILSGFPIANQFPNWFNQFGMGRVGGANGVPIPALVLIIVFFITLFILNYTKMGRATFAVGGNPESARLSGINVGGTKIFVFIIVQVMAVISGFMYSGQVMSGTYSFGLGWELDVIAAVIVGGTAFNGGAGSVWGTLVGIVFMGVIGNGMTLLNFDIYTQNVVRAVILFLAVLLSSYRAQAKA